MKRMIRILAILLTLCTLAPLCAGRALAEPDPADRFLDVPAGAWYRSAVSYVVGKGYFDGVSDDAFAPKASMTRAMLVTVLWRLAGCPAAQGGTPFTDVPAGAYYAAAVVWAGRTGVVNGVTDTTFVPNRPVTRVQTAAMLCRLAAALGYSASGGAGCIASFPDGDSVPAYGKASMGWTVLRGILNGREENELAWLRPNEEITRAEAACVLQRFDAYVREGKPVPAEVPALQTAPGGGRTLWVDGVKTEAGLLWGRVPYLEASVLAELGGGEARWEGNVMLSVFGHRLFLSKLGSTALIDGVRTVLSAPCRYYEGRWYVPVRLLSERLGWDRLEDDEENQSFFTPVPDSAALPAGKRVVILRYHCVSDEIWGDEGAFMSPADLEEQIREMKRMGCSFLTFEDLDRADQYELPVLLTFDDGYADNYTELLPILRRQNVKATVFMITGHIGRARYLTADQIRALSASGLVSVQSHTHTHADLSTLSGEELRQELSRSRLILARLTGKAPFVLSYPKGRENGSVQAATAEQYRFGVLANTSPFITGTNPFTVSRFGMPRGITKDRWKAYFTEKP